jgi:hypothetical protein
MLPVIAASPTTESLAYGDVVPMPTFPIKYEEAEVVAIRLPTVSWVPVAMRLPEALEVIIEFGEKVVAEKI